MNNTAIGALYWGFFDRFNDRKRAAELFASANGSNPIRALVVTLFAEGERGPTTVLPGGGMSFSTVNEIKHQEKTYTVELLWQYCRFAFRLVSILVRSKDE